MKNPVFVVALSAVISSSFIVTAHADKLDDIIGSGKLRCAVTLDFPPMGSGDEANKPVGFDVDYGNDLAKVLGVDAEIVAPPLPGPNPGAGHRAGRHHRDLHFRHPGEGEDRWPEHPLLCLPDSGADPRRYRDQQVGAALRGDSLA